MEYTMSNARYEYPLLNIGVTTNPPTSVKQFIVEPCAKSHAVLLTKQWHSRLPNVQSGPWLYAFKCSFQGYTYAVALWHNPSARGLPNNWLELRRLSAAPDAPKNTCSYMLGKMVKYFLKNERDIEKLISYQDMEVHTGSIYKASNWFPAYFSRPRMRDRSKPRKNTKRQYRSDSNSAKIAASPKIRWEYNMSKHQLDHESVKKNLDKFYGLYTFEKATL